MLACIAGSSVSILTSPCRPMLVILVSIAVPHVVLLDKDMDIGSGLDVDMDMDIVSAQYVLCSGVSVGGLRPA